MSARVVPVAGLDARRLEEAVDEAAAEARKDGETVVGIAGVLDGTAVLLFTERSATGQSISEEIAELAALKDRNALGAIEFDNAKRALLRTLGA